MYIHINPKKHFFVCAYPFPGPPRRYLALYSTSLFMCVIVSPNACGYRTSFLSLPPFVKLQTGLILEASRQVLLLPTVAHGPVDAISDYPNVSLSYFLTHVPVSTPVTSPSVSQKDVF